MKWLKTRGRLIYDPERFEFKKTHKQRTLIVELPWDDLDLYYQWFIRKQKGTWFDHELRTQMNYNAQQTAMREIDENVPCVTRPMWGKHVTIVRGDEPGYLSPNWTKYHNREIDIFYSPKVHRQWKFWSLPVKGDNLFELRTMLGLRAFHDFHITIARELNNVVLDQKTLTRVLND